ncbi:MAG: hypothetical protein JXQ30_14805 [Spirochaetes bacterium]|nr:hypothetical protein [Spirochaetota bacterium]
MKKKNLFNGFRASAIQRKAAIVLTALLIVALAVLLTTCAGGAGSGGGVFTLVTGSGTVTVNLVGANGAQGGATFYFGTSSVGEPIGGETTISSDNMSLPLKSGDDDIVFTGGTELIVGGFIDADYSGPGFYMPEDGDLMASKTVTVSGNTTVTLNYPDDFSEPVTGSGTVTVNLVGAGDFEGTNFYFGTISTGTPFGGQQVIASPDDSWPIQSEGSVIFTGGLELIVGGFIDVNGNGDDFHMADDGDLMASKTVTVSGDTVVTLTY